jgi:hypothetical protein
MDLTRYTSNHQLSYGEELALYRETGATPILDESAAPWTYVLPGVVVADGKIAEILAGAEDIAEPPPFYEPFVLDDIFVERPRKYGVPVAGDDTRRVFSGDVGIDPDSIDYSSSVAPQIASALGESQEDLDRRWQIFTSHSERRGLVDLIIFWSMGRSDE